MKKKSVGRIIARTFLKTFGVLFLLVAVGVSSYLLTRLYYKTTAKTERSTTYTHVIDVNPGANSINLIYSVKKDTKYIDGIVLEVLNADTKNLDYITLPASGTVQLSADMYTKLIQITPELPQIVRLTSINKYFDSYCKGDQAFEYGIMILEDTLNIDIGYCTIMDSELFHKDFVNTSGDGEQTCYRPSDALLAQVKDAKGDESKIRDFISDSWEAYYSNITCNQKMSKYAGMLSQVNPDYIYAHQAAATKTEKTFVIDTDATKKLYKKLLNNDAYKVAQKSTTKKTSKTTKTKSSKALKIQLLNASGITGLAASFKTKLEGDGYTNLLEPGNYMTEKLTHTKIIVKKKSVGKDLKAYFKSPVLEVGTVTTTGADIEILIGSEDSNEVAGY